MLVAPRQIDAQARSKIFRVGILGTVPVRTLNASDWEAARIWNGFFDAMHEAGYIEGQNLLLEMRFSEGRAERLPDLAAELVRANVDVIVAAAQTAVSAKAATSTTPIVMTNFGDPIGGGLVASLARPGGNVTGLTTLNLELVGKNLQLLHEVLPKAKRVVVLSNPDNAHHQTSLRQANAAASALSLQLLPVETRSSTDLTAALPALVKWSPEAFFVVGDATLFGMRAEIVEVATKHGLPLFATQREFPKDGGLLAYGVDQRDIFRRAAGYVVKILRGAHPSELPIEQPTKFELVINVRSARKLGLSVSPTLLARADEVIE